MCSSHNRSRFFCAAFIAASRAGPRYHRAGKILAREADMDKRRSISVPGASHTNPIPGASRRGPFVVSGAIGGTDPETGKIPEDLDAQCAQMFANVRRLIEAAGGTPEDIVKMTVW